MPNLSWFPSVASGTAISAANAGFDALLFGAGNTANYDNTHALHSPAPGKFQTVAASPQAALMWTTQWGTQTQVYASMYLYLTAYPAAGVRFMNAVMTTSNTVMAAGFDMQTDGKIQLKSDGAGFVGATSANPIPLNQWVRWEYDATISTTVGAFASRLFYNPESFVADDAWAVTGQNMAANSDAVRVGFDSDGQGPMWIDAARVSTTFQPGPLTRPIQLQPYTSRRRSANF